MSYEALELGNVRSGLRSLTGWQNPACNYELVFPSFLAHRLLLETRAVGYDIGQAEKRGKKEKKNPTGSTKTKKESCWNELARYCFLVMIFPNYSHKTKKAKQKNCPMSRSQIKSSYSLTTSPFPISELQSPSIDGLDVVQKRQHTNLEALEVWKSRSDSELHTTSNLISISEPQNVSTSIAFLSWYFQIIHRKKSQAKNLPYE